jgi:hypothetical protein
LTTHVKPRAATGATKATLYAHGAYFYVKTRLTGAFKHLFVSATNYINSNIIMGKKVELLGAYTPEHIATIPVATFMASETVHSCAKLRSFLQRYRIQCTTLTLIYVQQGILTRACIDLKGEIDLISGKKLLFGDIDFENLTKMVIDL